MLGFSSRWNPYAESNEVDALLSDIAGMTPKWDNDNGGLVFCASEVHFRKGDEIACDEEGHFLKFVDEDNFNEEMWEYRRGKYNDATERTPMEPSKVYGAILAGAPALYLKAKKVCQTMCRGGKACAVCGLKKILNAMETYNRHIEG